MKKPSYIQLIKHLKEEILLSRYTAAKLVNKEILILYFKVGKVLVEKIEVAGYGAKVIENISNDLQANLPGLRGFSATNLKYMKQFYENYSFIQISQSPTDEFKSSSETQIRQSPTDESFSVSKAILKPINKKNTPILTNDFFANFFSISFSHHYKIISNTANWNERLFYINHSAQNQWTVKTLEHHLETNFYKSKGKMMNNFKQQLPKKIQERAIQAFRDEYILDFINIQDPNEIDERIIEQSIVNNIKQFLLSLGKEFAFMGNQYRLSVGDEEFFIDLLFYHRGLRCLIAFELKSGKFKPEYGGKMSFYLNVLNKQIKLPAENPSIGVILCKQKNNTVVEYSFTDSTKPIGVGTYKLTDKIPQKLKKYLPTTEDLINIVNEPTIEYVVTKK